MNYAYMPACDMAVFLVSIVLLLVLQAMYHQGTRRYAMVMLALLILVGESLVSIVFNFYIMDNLSAVPESLVYLAHNTLYTGLILELVIFIFYLQELINYRSIWQTFAIWLLVCVFCLMELTSSFTHFGFYIEDGVPHQTRFTNFYLIWYGLFLILIFITIARKNKLVVNRIYRSISCAFGVSVGVTIAQCVYQTETFTTMTYFIPIMVVVILFHCNSYNSSYGSLDRTALLSKVNRLIQKKKNFVLVNVVVPHFHLIENSPQTAEDFKNFVRSMNYKDYLFRYAEDSFVMIFPKGAKVEAAHDIFQELHKKYQMTHTITVVDSNDYCHSLEDYMDLCTVGCGQSFYRVSESDLQKFNRANIIRKQLLDIEEKNDLDDPRVKVYCQPILDINTRTFTTAEALMRMELPELGFIYPDQFIPIAEEGGTIHTLTSIILNKVCRFLEFNGEIKRISVNFSMIEIVKPGFYEDIYRIISSYTFDYKRLGFEITESMEAEDFDVIKDVLAKFRKLGITIYLDDFGTGYSNLEHITKLPIDVIKFDRSLVISSGENKASAYMVSSLANMFNIIGYNLLYEGIEDEPDQKRCIGMKAGYLQGYRYSRPIPIEQLKDFINKRYEEELEL